MEIRYAPSYIASGHSCLLWEDIHSAVKRGTNKAVDEIGSEKLEVMTMQLPNRFVTFTG